MPMAFECRLTTVDARSLVYLFIFEYMEPLGKGMTDEEREKDWW
jgi:hypothetical protein